MGINLTFDADTDPGSDHAANPYVWGIAKCYEEAIGQVQSNTFPEVSY